jgi:hypothetical protein
MDAVLYLGPSSPSTGGVCVAAGSNPTFSVACSHQCDGRVHGQCAWQQAAIQPSVLCAVINVVAEFTVSVRGSRQQSNLQCGDGIYSANW